MPSGGDCAAPRWAAAALATLAALCAFAAVASSRSELFAPSALTTSRTAPVVPRLAPAQYRAPVAGASYLLARPAPPAQAGTAPKPQGPWPTVGGMALAFVGMTAAAARLLGARAVPTNVVAMAAVAGERKRPSLRKGKYVGYEKMLRAVPNVTYEQVPSLLLEGYTLVDVRPKYEWDRIHPQEAVHVQFIMENPTEGLDLMSFGRKWAATTYAGYTRDLIRNPNFIEDMAAKFPKDAKLIMTCGDGLRSLVAATTLQEMGGFTALVWLQDGLQMVLEGEGITSAGTDVGKGYANAGLDPGLLALFTPKN